MTTLKEYFKSSRLNYTGNVVIYFALIASSSPLRKETSWKGLSLFLQDKKHEEDSCCPTHHFRLLY